MARMEIYNKKMEIYNRKIEIYNQKYGLDNEEIEYRQKIYNNAIEQLSSQDL